MATGDHFYTISSSERNNAVSVHGYIDEGIACYVYPVQPQSSTIVLLYRYYAPWSGDHFYTTNHSEGDDAVVSGYTAEGTACFIFSTLATNRVRLYRLYNSQNGDHFYTTSRSERDSAVAGGYQNEGTAGYVYSGTGPNRQPLFRLYAPWSGDHFYTTSANERNSAIAGNYVSEGTACYVPIPDPAETIRVPLYRLYNQSNGDHLYTTNIRERGNALGIGYVEEGIACYVLSRSDAGAIPLYRLYAPWNGDHFYTTSATERNNAIAGGYIAEGMACYVFGSRVGGTTALYRVYRGHESYYGLNVILVGIENFAPGDIAQVRDSIEGMRGIFATVKIGVDNVQWYQITVAEAGSHAVIDSEAESEDLTKDWTFPNRSLDFFVVRVMNGADGWSAVDGSCDKDSKGMSGSVVSLNGSTANSSNTFAHEIGHYLGLDHIPDTGNFIGGNGNSDSWIGIHTWQGRVMKRHCLMHT